MNPNINSAGALDVNESQADNTAGFVPGADVQRIMGAGLNYDFGKTKVGFVYIHSRVEGSTSFGSQGGSVSACASRHRQFSLTYPARRVAQLPGR